MNRVRIRLAAVVTCLALGAGLLPTTAGAQIPDPVNIVGTAAGLCDDLDASKCLLPFPNDFFTAEDASTDTGKRLDFPVAGMPRNIAGRPIDPTEWNRNDGFSPGAMIMTHVPGVDLDVTSVAPITDIARSLDEDAPIVLLNADTGERHIYWAELDANANSADDQMLIVRPAANLEEGARYIVALLHLKDSEGQTIEAGDVFAAYRDGETSGPRAEHFEAIFGVLEGAGVSRDDLYLAWDFTVASSRSLAERVLHMRDEAFGDYLGDEAPGRRGDDGHPGGEAPSFTVGRVETNIDDQIARRVTGTFTVPSYLTVGGGCTTPPPESPVDCAPVIGSRLNYLGATDRDGNSCGPTDPTCLPARLGGSAELTANYTCIIPKAALSDGAAEDATVTPGHAALYGHGLLGGAGEVSAGNVRAMANEQNFVFCATDWIGMATEDVPNVATILPDMSNFPSLADRAQQGFLNFLFLGRLMIHPDGFASHGAFQGPEKLVPKDDPGGGSGGGKPENTPGGKPENPGGGKPEEKPGGKPEEKPGGGNPGSPGEQEMVLVPQPVIDTSALYYDGNSQGGIMGGALTAIAQDFTRAVLGVPGMNYSTLLNRSVDFEGVYSEPVYLAYPDRMDQQLIFGLIQMLWDRAEANGYAHHMTDDPYPDTPAHQVLLHVAHGDHQVAVVSADVEARTIGASVLQPALMEGRSPDVEPFWGIPTVCGEGAEPCDDDLPFAGSAMVVWDFCTALAPSTCRTPPPPTTNTPPREGSDPHGRPRAQTSARLQKAAFLTQGYLIDVCDAKPCLSP